MNEESKIENENDLILKFGKFPHVNKTFKEMNINSLSLIAHIASHAESNHIAGANYVCVEYLLVLSFKNPEEKVMFKLKYL